MLRRLLCHLLHDRPQRRVTVLGRLVGNMATDGAVFMTMEQAAEEAKAKLFSS